MKQKKKALKGLMQPHLKELYQNYLSLIKDIYLKLSPLSNIPQMVILSITKISPETLYVIFLLFMKIF